MLLAKTIVATSKQVSTTPVQTKDKTLTDAYTHSHLHLQTRTCTCICTHLHLHPRIHTCTNTHTHPHLYIYTDTPTLVQIHTHPHLHKYTRTPTRTGGRDSARAQAAAQVVVCQEINLYTHTRQRRTDQSSGDFACHADPYQTGHGTTRTSQE
jgi:hypothetical protein